jgi:hypothetical protein
MSNSPFLGNLLKAMRFPHRESAHQELLAAALMTKPALVKELLPNGGGACFLPRQGGEAMRGQICGVDWSAGAAVTLEHVPATQTSRKRSRYDILVTRGDAAVVIECKWGSGTSATQLLEYAALMKRDYPNKSALVLTSVDGAPPAGAGELAERCGLPLFFFSWKDVMGLMKQAMGEEATSIRESIGEYFEAVDAFSALLRSGCAVKASQATGTVDQGDGEDDSDGNGDLRGRWRDFHWKGRDYFLSPCVAADRAALYALASAVKDNLPGDWRVILPPAMGPRGDIQCDLAPTACELPFFFNGAPLKWRKDLESLTEPVKGYQAMALQFVLRLYFSPVGEFRVHIGADLAPYLHNLAPAKDRHKLNPLIPKSLGQYSTKGRWAPGETLQGIHNAVLAGQINKPTRWSREHGTSPTMWQRYFTLDGIAEADSTSRVERIRAAVQQFCSCDS